MILTFDDVRGTIGVRSAEGDAVIEYPLADPRAFALMAKAWLRAGWDAKYVYTFSWLGRPIIQLPDDIVRLQEVIFNVRPSLIIETGVAHGGSLIFHASLLKAMDIPGRVVGIDIEIRPHNRAAIEAHQLSSMITLIEGDAVAGSTVDAVSRLVGPEDVVLVVLDSNHSRDHVARELEAYASFVTPGSYIVATDGIMKDLAGAPRASDDWSENNPHTAACDFAATHPEFEQREPAPSFDESTGIKGNVTYWPGAWLRRRHIHEGET